MSTIAIITARGGSKRIPNKNFRDFCGKPILLYSIEAALESGIYDEVMISTDSPIIAELAKSAGASLPFMRSEKTSTDFASTTDVLDEVLMRYAEMGKNFENMSCIYPTAPFINARKLREAYQRFQESNADRLTCVVPFGYPPQRAFVIRDGNLVYQYPEYREFRSQDLETIYHDCGQFYFFKVKPYLEKKQNIITVPYMIPEDEMQDIDNESDWRMAEIKYQRFLERENAR